MPASHFAKKYNVSMETAKKINAAYMANKNKDVVDLDEFFKERNDLLRSKAFSKKLHALQVKTRNKRAKLEGFSWRREANRYIKKGLHPGKEYRRLIGREARITFLQKAKRTPEMLKQKYIGG